MLYLTNLSVTKMPGGQRKISADWLSAVDNNGQKISEWCQEGKDDCHGYCCFFDTDVM